MKFDSNRIEIGWDTTVSAVLREIGLPPTSLDLVLVMIELSGGQSVFNPSLMELAKASFGSTPRQKDPRSAIRGRISSLAKWQVRSGIELIRKTRIGRRVPNSEEVFEYEPSQYQFVAIKDLVESIYSGDKDAIRGSALQFVTNAKFRRTVPESLPIVNLRRVRQRDIRTATTKLLKVGINEIQEGRDPFHFLNETYDSVESQLERMLTDHKDYQEKNLFLKEFDESLRFGDLLN